MSSPAKPGQNRDGPQVGEAAPTLEVVDDSGRRFALAELWRERPLVLVFIRHFGCPFCREQLLDMRDEQKRFRDAGGEAAVVAMGTPQQAAEFRRRMNLPFVVLADAEQQLYRAFGVGRGTFAQIAGPAVWLSGAKALLRGGVGKPTGDVLQMSAAFVIDQHGIVRLAHRSVNSADNPTNDELIEKLQQISGD